MKRSYLIILILILAAPIKAQNEDFVTWWNFTLKGEITKKLNYSIQPELRLFENSSELSSWQTEFNIGYEARKNLDIGGIYRYTVDFEKPNYNRRINRFSLYLKYQFKTGDFKWQYRGIWQNDFVNYNTSSNGMINHMGHRHKVSVKHQDKDWPFDPTVGVEYYFSNRPYKDHGEWKQRWFITIERDISKRLSAKLSYKRQNEFNVKNPDITNILMVGLEYEPRFLKRKKKKTKKD